MSSRPLYLGPRLKRLRREFGLTQQAMADELGISPSYIALIERNQRPLTADLLIRLARAYKLDMADLAADERDDYARRLSDSLRDPIFADIDLPPLEVADVAASFPGVTEALLRLYGAWQREQQALADQRHAEPGSSAGPGVFCSWTWSSATAVAWSCRARRCERRGRSGSALCRVTGLLNAAPAAWRPPAWRVQHLRHHTIATRCGAHDLHE